MKEPYTVVLHSALIDAMDELELKSVVGHEMGHIRFGHTRAGAFVGNVHNPQNLPFPINALTVARNLIFLWWSRVTEMTADRAGVVACRRLSKAVSAEVKLNVGPTLYQHTNVDDLAHQADEMSHGWMRFWGWLGQASATHPFMVYRIRAMVQWSGGVEPGHELHLRDPNAFSQVLPTVPGPLPVEMSPRGAATAVADGAEPRTGDSTRPPPLAPPPTLGEGLGRGPFADHGSDSPTTTTIDAFIPTEPTIRLPLPASLEATVPGVGLLHVALDGRELVLGRGEGSTFRIDHPSVSRQHFRIYWEANAYRVADLGSSNGTKVNDEPITVQELHDGDVVRAGAIRFTFRLA